MLHFSTILSFGSLLTAGHAVDQDSQQVQYFPVDDAYVVGDLNDPDDRMGLRDINTGNLDFLKVWYAWNVTGAEGMKIVSVAYLKFDLSDVNREEIKSAKLRLYAQNITVTDQSRFVDVHLGSDASWTESTITYPSAPSFPTTPISSLPILATDSWYQWDVTEAVKEKANSNVTFAILLEQLIVDREEQIVFVSKDSHNQALRPSLVIETTDQSAIPAATPSDIIPFIIAGVIIAGAAAGGTWFILYRKK